MRQNNLTGTNCTPFLATKYLLSLFIVVRFQQKTISCLLFYIKQRFLDVEGKTAGRIIEERWWMCYLVRLTRIRSATLCSILKTVESFRGSLYQYQFHWRLARRNLCKDWFLSTICHVTWNQVRKSQGLISFSKEGGLGAGKNMAGGGARREGRFSRISHLLQYFCVILFVMWYTVVLTF